MFKKIISLLGYWGIYHDKKYMYIIPKGKITTSRFVHGLELQCLMIKDEDTCFMRTKDSVSMGSKDFSFLGWDKFTDSLHTEHFCIS